MIAPTQSRFPFDGDLVLTERFGPVVVLTFNRPDQLNAWTNDLESRYFALLDEAEADPETGAVVITGSGRGFCAGADIHGLRAATIRGTVETDAELPRPRWFPMTLRKPLIAAINGPAAGLGLVEALYADVRFCTPEAKLTTSFARRGLIAEHGMSWLLTNLVGPSVALDLLMSGRTVEGAEAHQVGLVNRVVPRAQLIEAAVTYARELATLSSPTSVATMKEQVRRDLERGFAEAERDADSLMVESLARPDAREGVESYLERRTPNFAPLGRRS